MSIMAESGIDVGVESHLTLLLGMIRAGKSLAEVEAKMSEATTTSNVVFGDHEVFRLIVELVRAGNKVGAFSRTCVAPGSGIGFGSVGRAVASDTSGLRFKSSGQ